MPRRFWLINLGFAALVLGGLVAASALALAVASSTYTGVCNGFTDGAWPCPWSEYASIQAFYALLIAMLPLGGLGALWGGYAAAAATGRLLAQRMANVGRAVVSLGAAGLGGAAGLAAVIGLVLLVMHALEGSAALGR
jgi:hypothetical protein